MTVACGGCQGLGAHVRWCPEVVGVRASRLGVLADRVEALADEIGATSPQAANDLYRVAAHLLAEAKP